MTTQELHRCAECGYHYANKQWAERCEAWCKANNSCNLDITSHAVENRQEQGAARKETK